MFTDRDSLEGEARARYTSAVISGTVMMLSDDYERPEARTRAELLATNREVNALAASMVSFCICGIHGCNRRKAVSSTVSLERRHRDSAGGLQACRNPLRCPLPGIVEWRGDVGCGWHY